MVLSRFAPKNEDIGQFSLQIWWLKKKMYFSRFSVFLHFPRKRGWIGGKKMICINKISQLLLKIQEWDYPLWKATVTSVSKNTVTNPNNWISFWAIIRNVWEGITKLIRRKNPLRAPLGGRPLMPPSAASFNKTLILFLNYP